MSDRRADPLRREAGPRFGRSRRALAITTGALCALAVLAAPLIAPEVARAPAVVALAPRLTAAVAAVPHAAPFGDGSPYPGPLPLAIPATGGVIQAENFNSGTPEQAYHACTPGDQGNAARYRSDRHDIDIDLAPGGQFYISSSSPYTSANATHDCPKPLPFFSDYVKYSFTVAATGYYRFTAAGQNGEFFTRVDDIDEGQTALIHTWQNVVLAPAVHLTAGSTHVLTVELLGFKTGLDAIYVAPVVVHFPTPRIVPAPLTTDEVVVADAVVTDPQFGAVRGNAGFDDRSRIQRALTLVGDEGGGTVFLPPGVYTVKGPLFVPANVTLRGDWSVTTSTPGQTIIAARVPTGRLTKPLINLMGPDAGVSHMSVWYPNQSFTHPLPYPPTIRSFVPAVNVEDVTLYNSDQGVSLRAGSSSDISGLRATCFTTCIVDDGDLEYSFITNIKVSNQVWSTAPVQVTGKPTSKANLAALNKWTSHHLVAMHLYRNDNLTVYGVTVANAQHGIVTTRSDCKPNCGTYGSFSKISASLDRSGDYVAARPARGVNGIMDTDLVSHAKNITYHFAPAREPARTSPSDFYDVMAPPFSAHADGMTDDTAAIQSALDTAAAHGGGTVYLPSGTYLVSTHLVVPSGVELRGAYADRHTSETVDSTTLLAVEGQGTATPNTDPAFISLSADAGVRGISVRYPDQGFGSAAYPVTTFPFTIRSLGPSTWVENVNVLNGYQIVDLATYRSDGFVVKNLWATAFANGVNIGGGTQTGWLEQAVISYGDLYESRHGNSPHAYGKAQVENYTSRHVVAYYVGNVNGLQSLGANSFRVAQHLVTYRTTTGPTNSLLFASSSDSAGSAAFVFTAGTKFSFVGTLARSAFNNANVSTSPAFGGVASLDDAALAGNGGAHGSAGIVRKGGTVHVYPENLPLRGVTNR